MIEKSWNLMILGRKSWKIMISFLENLVNHGKMPGGRGRPYLSGLKDLSVMAVGENSIE